MLMSLERQVQNMNNDQGRSQFRLSPAHKVGPSLKLSSELSREVLLHRKRYNARHCLSCLIANFEPTKAISYLQLFWYVDTVLKLVAARRLPLYRIKSATNVLDFPLGLTLMRMAGNKLLSQHKTP